MAFDESQKTDVLGVTAIEVVQAPRGWPVDPGVVLSHDTLSI
jgi:hypothetical protein